MPVRTLGGRGRMDMPDLHIRRMEPEVMDRLKAQAKRNHRSMEAEARTIISANLQLTMAEWLEGADLLRERLGPTSGPSNLELVDDARRELDARREPSDE
jgi:plasmid stability protein